MVRGTAPADDFTAHIDTIILVHDVRDIMQETIHYQSLFQMVQRIDECDDYGHYLKS